MKILISEKIRLYCRLSGKSLKELSEYIGISQTGIQGILRNNSTTFENLIKISNFFKTSIYEFVEPDNDIEKEQFNLLKNFAEADQGINDLITPEKFIKSEEKIKHLESIIIERDKKIELLEKIIGSMEKQIRLYENIYGSEKK